jgi:hypothetical protein
MVNGAKPSQVGDVCYSDAHTASVTNTDAGKVVKVKDHVIAQGTPVIEVVSAFLYRGRFAAATWYIWPRRIQCQAHAYCGPGHRFHVSQRNRFIAKVNVYSKIVIEL